MKIKNIVTIWLIALILASCTSETTFVPPTKPFTPSPTFAISASTATVVSPNQTPTQKPTDMPTLPPTGAPLPAFMDGFEFADQFQVERVTTHIACMIDENSFRRTDFKIVNLRILYVVDCYLIDNQGKLQKVALPVGMYDEEKNLAATWSIAIWSPPVPNLEFIRNKIEAVWADGQVQSYRKGGFNTARSPLDGADWSSFLGTAVDAMQSSAAGLNSTGNTDDLPDYPDAENFVMPMTAG